MLLDVIAKKKFIFIYPKKSGHIEYVNNLLSKIGRKIDFCLDLFSEQDSPEARGCKVLLIERLAEFDINDVAVFTSRYASPDDRPRQLHRWGLVHNHSYFFIEDFTPYPIRENYTRNTIHAPWSMDGEFLDIYNKVRNNTQLDITRCFELASLMKQTSHLAGNVLEVGVRYGGSGYILAAYANKYNKKMYLADTFRGFVNADPLYDFGNTNSNIGSYKHIAEDLFSRNNLGNHVFLEGCFPEDTGSLIENEQFCLCHIDTDMYWAYKNPTEWIWDRLSVGGVIIYDDYGFTDWSGATQYVDEIATLEDRLFVYNLNGHGIIIKLK